MFCWNLFLVQYYFCCRPTQPILLSWSSLMVFLSICMLMTFKYASFVRRHQSISCRCACRPVLTPLPTGCHQIDCSLMPSRQSSYGAHQVGDRVNSLLYHSECSAITWHRLQPIGTWAFTLTLTSACIPKSHELSRRASAFWGSYAAFVVRCLTRSSSL